MVDDVRVIASGPLVDAGPVSLSAPRIIHALIGVPIVFDPGAWHGAESVEYQFRRDGLPLAPPLASYTPVVEDEARPLYVVETARDRFGMQAFAASDPVRPREAIAPDVKAPPEIHSADPGQLPAYDLGRAFPGEIKRVIWRIGGEIVAEGSPPVLPEYRGSDSPEITLEVVWTHDLIDVSAHSTSLLIPPLSALRDMLFRPIADLEHDWLLEMSAPLSIFLQDMTRATIEDMTDETMTSASQ